MSKKASKSKSADQDFPFDNDSEDEEPKYLWRNVTKNGCIKKCVLVDGKMELGMDFFISGQKTKFWVIPCNHRLLVHGSRICAAQICNLNF